MQIAYLILAFAVLNCLAVVAAMHLSGSAPSDTEPEDWQALIDRIREESQLD